MKKIGKINLENVNASEFLSESEMKRVVGGYEVVIYGYSSSPCPPLQYGGCHDTSAYSGEPCDYVSSGFVFTGTCKTYGDLLNQTTSVGWPLVTTEHPYVCHGTSSKKC